MTSQHVELAFARTKEVIAEAWGHIPCELMSASLFETVFNAFLHCDDDAKPKVELKEAA